MFLNSPEFTHTVSKHKVFKNLVKVSYRVGVKLARQKVSLQYMVCIIMNGSQLQNHTPKFLFCPFRIDQIVKSELHMPEWSQT